MEKDFKICFALLHRALGTSVASVRSSAAPLYKGDTGGLQRGRGDWRRLSAMVCGRLAGARRTASARLLVAVQSLDQKNPPYTSTVLVFVGGGSVNVLRMWDLARA